MTSVALVLIVTVGAIALSRSRQTKFPLRPAMTEVAAADLADLAGLDSPTGLRKPLTTVSQPGATETASTEPGLPTEEAPPSLKVGTIEGMVLDSKFEPMPFERLLFRRIPAEDGVTPVKQAHGLYSGRDGRYSIQVVPGLWEVRFIPRRGEEQLPTPRVMGRVLVEPNSLALFDVHVHSGRTIRGGAILRELENSMLEISLFKDDESRELVMRTDTWNDLQEERIWKKGKGDPGENDILVRPGIFIFSGLEPGIYVLRIHMTPNEGFYLDERVDVRVEDVELEFREFTVVDFYRAMAKREGREE